MDEQSWIALDVQGRTFALAAHHVVEMIDCRRTRVTPMLASRPPALGFVQHRGRCCAVVDAGLIFGAEATNDRTAELRVLFQAAIDAHTARLQGLDDLASGSVEPDAIAPEAPSFESWSDALLASPVVTQVLDVNPAAAQLLEALHEPYERLCDVATNAQTQINEREPENVCVATEAARRTDLAALERLSAEFVEACESHERPILLLADVRGQHLGLMVSGVRSILHFNPEEVQAVKTDLPHSEAIVGVYPCEQHGDVLVIDAAKVSTDAIEPELRHAA